MARKVRIADAVLGDLTDDRLTADYRVFQRADGHRFSVDDVATAYVASRACKVAPKRIVDLGTGLGSVLLHLAWFFPEAELVGIEAQEVSFELLKRNVNRNKLSDRVRILHGDIRDEKVLQEAGGDFDLVTGTPPYFPEGAAQGAHDMQRAYARVEYRGGVEAYLAAAKFCMKEHAHVVICGDSHADARVRSAASRSATANTGVCESRSLVIAQCTDIIAKVGKSPLFSIWLLHAACDRAFEEIRNTLTLRSEEGALMPDAKTLRAFSGFETTADVR
jgi:tRNA1Val (adenine37-N6)-methyltransferase